MKKITKNIFSVLSAMAIIATGAINTQVSALNISSNPDYVEYIKTLEISEEEDWLIDYMTSANCYGYADLVHHVYESSNSLFFEFGDINDDYRLFYRGFIQEISMEVPDENVTITVEELNEFLQSEGIDATVKSLRLSTDCYGNYLLKVKVDSSNKLKAFGALCIEYGFEPAIMFQESGSVIFEFSDNNEQTATESTTAVTFGTPTIAGDANMDGATSMADIAKLAKYTSNAELFPITDPTALANADVTQDGVIDSLDTNMLIEMALGTYESAL